MSMASVFVRLRFPAARVPAHRILCAADLECRKRGRRADDTWIEQLATKRAKIGAVKTIAVSASGFSDSAQLTAGQHGRGETGEAEPAPCRAGQYR